MNLTEMKSILANEAILLTKSLGQNFLHDGNQLRRIAAAGELTREDKVLEVGPGLGPLTELLIEKAGEVLAIEKDQRLFEVVQRRFSPYNNFSVIRDDALDLIKRERRDWSDWKMVANLPYSVASPILVELAQSQGCPKLIVATLQLEVGRRIMAKSGEADYGILSLLLQLRYEPVGSFKIPAECFFPSPDVDSACVVLKRRAEPLLPLAMHSAFDHLVKLGFSQRRKMMFKLLKQEWPVELITRAFEELGLSTQIRAEKVSLEQFAALTKLLGEK